MKKDQRILQSEQAIIEASIKLLLSNPSAGMKEIALASGVGRTTLYRRFESKELLVQSITKICLHQIDSIAVPIQHLRGRKAIEAIIEFIMPIADRFRFLMSMWHLASTDKSIQQIQSRQLDAIYTFIEQAKADGDIDNNLPTLWVTTFFDMTLAAAWSLLELGEISPTDATVYMKHSFFKGCGL